VKTTTVGAYGDRVKQAGAAWIKDPAPTLGATLAFYSAFALAPLLIIVIARARTLWGIQTAGQMIVHQLAGPVGAPAAEALQALLPRPCAPPPAPSPLSSAS